VRRVQLLVAMALTLMIVAPAVVMIVTAISFFSDNTGLITG
jgi:hypothetical protein